MPESSLVITARDNYTSALKTMSSVTRSFSKDQDEMMDKLEQLNRTKATLKVDTEKARQELRDAEKAFAATGDEAHRLDLELKSQNYENARRNLSLVTKGASEAERQMQQTENTFRKAGNSMSGNGMSVIKALGTAGVGALLGNAAQNIASKLVSSAGGSAAGTVFSGALSTGISGAAIGNMVVPGGIGAAIGALSGALVGAINGAVQAFEQKDDAFKSYVQDAYSNVTEAQSDSISNGSTIAAGRETDLISFSTLFGSKSTASTYLSSLVNMANKTPFLYDDLTAMSKTLATYGYGANSILPVLQTIGDTGAALGMSTSDMTTVATALGRMKSSDKASLEYLNMLNDRGIGAVGILSDAYNVDQGTMYDMISKGEISGKKAAEILLQAMSKSFAGSMEQQSQTFSGLSSTLEGLQGEMDNAMGVGYNDTRKQGMQDQIDWLSGASGEAQQEANKAIGAWQASLENSKEKYIRDAVDTAMNDPDGEYQQAKAAGDAAKMGEIIMAAKVRGQNEYNASEGAQLQLESEKSLIQTIRDDSALNSDYYDAGYALGQEFTKGLAAAKLDYTPSALSPELYSNGSARQAKAGNSSDGTLTSSNPRSSYYSVHAYGLARVPYDGYPALLHEGERVLTAGEARTADRKPGGVQVTVTGNQFIVRSDTDIDAVADALAEKISRAAMLAAPAS